MHAARCQPGRPALAPATRFLGRLRFNRARPGVCRGELLERSSSGGDDEELDALISLELRQRAEGPEFFRSAARRFNLVWRVGAEKARKPGQCACCGGAGKGRCSFCRGTGALTLGDIVFCSLHDGCKPCPVCRSKGTVRCSHCSGTGFRAAWMEDPVCPADGQEQA